MRDFKRMTIRYLRTIKCISGGQVCEYIPGLGKNELDTSLGVIRDHKCSFL